MTTTFAHDPNFVEAGLGRMLAQFKSDLRIGAGVKATANLRLGATGELTETAFYRLPDQYWEITPSGLSSAVLRTRGTQDLVTDGVGVDVVEGTSPRGGNAFRFHDDTQTMTSLRLLSPAIVTPTFTLSFWLRVDGGSPDHNGHVNGQVIFAKNRDGSENGISSFQTVIRSDGWRTTDSFHSSESPPVPTGDWAWVTLRCESDGIYSYLNADPTSRRALCGLSEVDLTNTTELVFGRAPGGAVGAIDEFDYNFLTGQIADISVWFSTLTDQEMDDAYAWIQVKPFVHRANEVTGTGTATLNLVPVIDPYFANVVFMGHMDTISFVDSTGRHTGQTIQAKSLVDGLFGGAASGSVAISSVAYPSSADFAITSDWSLDVTAHFDAVGVGTQMLVGTHSPGASLTWQLSLEPSLSGCVGFFDNGSFVCVDPTPVVAGDTLRYRVTRSSTDGKARLYRNGVLVATSSSTAPTTGTPPEPFCVGGAGSGGSANYGVRGWVDEVRVTTNVCRSSGSSYTLETFAFP